MLDEEQYGEEANEDEFDDIDLTFKDGANQNEAEVGP